MGKKQPETNLLEKCKSDLRHSVRYGLGAFGVPTLLIWLFDSGSVESKTASSILFLYFAALGFGPRIRKNAEKYFQLKNRQGR
ncbi:MAG: hypothetical protein II179_02205 [Alphaproteobacteria bacterium]|nr:hypothetical protein [Alphaproteobacteria bacterium]